MAVRADLQKLAALAAIIEDRALTALARAEAERRAADTARDALVAERRALSRAAAPDAAHLSGSVATWERWAEAEQRRRTAELAQRAAASEARKVQARTAFGRARVLETLAARAAAQARRGR